VKQIHRDSNKVRCFLLLNCLLTNNPAIFSNYIIMKWPTDTILYILQLLQVPSEHHVTSILITIAETIYNVLCKVWEPK